MEEDFTKIQRRAEALFHQSPYPTILWNTSMKVEDTNAALLTLTGFERDRVLAMTLKDFKVVSASGEGFEEAKQSRQNVTGEATFSFPTGKKIVVRHTVPLLDQKGNIENFLSIYQDITEERHKIEVIQQNEIRSKKIYTYLEQEIERAAQVYKQAAEGDLTKRFDFAPPDEDTQAVYNQLKKMKDSILGIIRNLQASIGDVNNRMQDLTSTAQNTSRSIEEASKGVQQIAINTSKVSDNSTKISEGFDQITKAMQDMSAAVEEITSSMESVSALSKETDDLALKGADMAGNAEKSMGEISTTSAKVHEIVIDVEKQMGEITKIVGIIRDLANQTNLLALNAAIEAARAGEAGRGFAVVATEVKSLAQESRNSAERIEEMIATLKNSTQHAASAMGESRVVVEKGEKMVTETVQSFKKIAEAIDKVAKSASEVAAATEEQAATTEEVTANINELGSFVERTTKEATDAAAATEESSAALDEITRMVQHVEEIANEATAANKKFKIA
ncbi:MAG: methyl-accepting chemotaxis protein [Methanoregula sp.]|jgi:methyl-accepting chemotaxis protein|uniref:methyl-accepting chemotaxis protein n=1 Tax=Methanoregula sp. TaxID=2052170 RepID=UPI0025FAB438|nr:methyl-accepting chemotaxis protein [Methanoregula sp.]MCK9630420.1 methyl-accepting chemotaxis protein [Methanoregula sp.]